MVNGNVPPHVDLNNQMIIFWSRLLSQLMEVVKYSEWRSIFYFYSPPSHRIPLNRVLLIQISLKGSHLYKLYIAIKAIHGDQAVFHISSPHILSIRITIWYSIRLDNKFLTHLTLQVPINIHQMDQLVIKYLPLKAIAEHVAVISSQRLKQILQLQRFPVSLPKQIDRPPEGQHGEDVCLWPGIRRQWSSHSVHYSVISCGYY